MIERAVLGRLKGDTPNVKGQEFLLKQSETIIGRGRLSDVQLTDPKVSRRHAILRIDQETYTLEDLNSSHGTLVNGERGRMFSLRDGDVIAVGETLLVFKTT